MCGSAPLPQRTIRRVCGTALTCRSAAWLADHSATASKDISKKHLPKVTAFSIIIVAKVCVRWAPALSRCPPARPLVT